MKALLVRLYGIVQGVGFRPYVYRLAERHGVNGYVANRGGAEVEVFVEGDDEAVDSFLARLVEEKPWPAEIWDIRIEEASPRGIKGFHIHRSISGRTGLSMIPPDIGVCDDCLREINDPGSRFYRYPFHSCVRCGPRFTIMYSSIWDRDKTSMKYFPMCEKCLGEYRDPLNTRRFHAQGISCPICGPRLWLADSMGEEVETGDPLREAAALIEEGNIVAVKGLGGFHLAALATDDDVVAELRRRKNRPRKPFAVMALDMAVAGSLIYLDESVVEYLGSPWRPIVIAEKREDARISRLVAPGLSTLGVMIAYTPLHYLLLAETSDKYLIMTSGNAGGERIIKDNREALEKLRGIADYFLLHNREIVNRVDDSVVRVYRGHSVFIRRSRGYAPRWLSVPVEGGRVVAFGAEISNAGAVALRDKIIPTQYVGDMDRYSNIEFLVEALGFLMRVYGISYGDAVLVADKHPAYATRRLAERLAEKHGSTLLLLQHHVAHAYSVLADRALGLDETYVAITIDGTGYGDDASIWGGEVLLLQPRDTTYQRLGHLEQSPCPGGDRAALNPRLMLAARLSTIYGLDEIVEIMCGGEGEGCIDEVEGYYRLASSTRIYTSSTGRHLDAASALLGVAAERTYEGEPAIRLEEASSRPMVFWSGCEIAGDGVVDMEKLFTWLVENKARLPVSVLAATAQYYIGYGLGCIAARYLGEASALLVAGGAAANSYIAEAIRRALREEGVGDKPVYYPRLIPVGDGGVAAGQALYGLLSTRR